MDNFYVYSHIRKDTGKCFYIGKGSKNRAWTQSSRNDYWKNIVKKHGYEVIILVNNISEQKAFEYESLFCKEIGYKNLTNIREENGWGGYKQSQETIDKRVKNTNYKEASIRRLKTLSEKPLAEREEINSKIGNANKKPKPDGFSKFDCDKRNQINNKISEKTSKMVFQYDLEGNFLNEFKSIKDAERFIRGDYSIHWSKLPNNIGDCCRGRQKTAYDFIWMFKSTGDKKIVVPTLKKFNNKPIIDIITKIEYPSAKHVAEVFDLKVNTLRLKLSGRKNNDTNFIYKCHLE